MNWLELFAALLGIVSVWFARKENILVFPFGITNVLIYIYICFSARLYANAGINAVYFISNVYGWYMWSRKDANDNLLSVSRNSLLQNSLSLFSVVGLYVLALFILRAANKTDAVYLQSCMFLTWMPLTRHSFWWQRCLWQSRNSKTGFSGLSGTWFPYPFTPHKACISPADSIWFFWCWRYWDIRNGERKLQIANYQLRHRNEN